MSWLAGEVQPPPLGSNYLHGYVDESYSRRLDASVQRQEMCYGYDQPPPPADTGDFHERAYETRMQSHLRGR
jgi:hypothetical protein